MFAPVAPIQILEQLKTEGLFGNYHLFLAHHTLEHPGRFQRLVEPGDPDVNRVFIMDNSIVELGSSCTVETMAKAVEPLLNGCGPNDAIVAVLPDAMGDGLATRRLIREQFFTWRAGLPENVRLMAVAQGSNWRDYCETIDFLKPYTDAGDIQAVGIPRVLTSPFYLGTRKQACFYASLRLANLNTGYSPLIHLLGFSDDVPDDLMNAAHFGYHIDSAVPLRAPADWTWAKEIPSRPKHWFNEGTLTDAARKHLAEIRQIIG